jgi:hypothetical protein
MDSFLQRSICLLEHLQSVHFDYFIRTNLSTLFNLDILIQWIQNLPKYNLIAGTPIDHLNSIYTEISGTNIILSRDLTFFLSLNKEKLLNESVLRGDDQRISSLIIENLNVNLLLVKRVDFIELSYYDKNGKEQYKPPSIVFQNCSDIYNLFCYRFKTKNRENDIKYMKMLLQHMYTEHFHPLQFVLDIVNNNPDKLYTKFDAQNMEYEKLTHTVFQINTTKHIMEINHRYKNITFKYLPSICQAFPITHN